MIIFSDGIDRKGMARREEGNITVAKHPILA